MPLAEQVELIKCKSVGIGADSKHYFHIVYLRSLIGEQRKYRTKRYKFLMKYTCIVNGKKKLNMKLETVSIAEPMQNRQHAQTPSTYLDQIWHATVGQCEWSMLTGLMSSGSMFCVADARQKCRNEQFRPNFLHFGCFCAHPLFQSGSNSTRDSRPTVYAYLLNFISISLFFRPLAAKNPKFCRFLDFIVLWCRQLAAYGES